MQTPAAVAVFRERLEAVVALATRTNKATVLVVQQFPVAEDAGVLFPHVRESIATIMGFVELGTADDLSWVLDTAHEAFNWIVVDCDQKLPGSAGVVALARNRNQPHVRDQSREIVVGELGLSRIGEEAGAHAHIVDESLGDLMLHADFLGLPPESTQA